MQPFLSAHAAADDWARAAKACVEGLGAIPSEANLGFVYASDMLAEDLPSILTFLRQRTGIGQWVGSVGLGVVAGTREYFDEPALAVMVAALPDDSFRVFPSLSESADQLPAEDQAWIDRAAPCFGIVHGDPTNPNTPGLIDALTKRTAGFLVGGLTSSRGGYSQVAGEVTDGGLSGVLFAPEIEVATGLSQGCTPVAGIHMVSECRDNIIIGLDGEPALDVFKQDVGELLARDLRRAAGYIHAGLPIEGSDTGDYMVRDLIGMDPERGWLAVGVPVHVGTRLMFVRRDAKCAEDDFALMLEKLKRRVDGVPRGGVYFSCVARGPNMFGDAGLETGMIRKAFGEFPVVGFFAGGEISNCRLYGYTGVLALFL